MTTLAISAAGATLSISVTLPATYDAAGFAAVSYTSIAEITDIGELGKKYTLVTHAPVGDRKLYKFKGGYDNGQLQIQLAKATSNAGQTILLAAAGSDASYSFRITMQDATDMYFTGKAMSFVSKVGGVNNIYGATVEVQLDSDIVETA